MLKKISLSVCLMLILFGGLYYFLIYSSVHEINRPANYITYDSEGALSNAADIILYGSPEDEFENREHVNDFYNHDYYTLTNFKVKEVIKNSTTLTINKSDSFEIIEPIGLIQQIDGKKIMHMDSYKAMEKDTRYIIYLKNNGMDGYSIINMLNGRFDMDDIDNSDNNIDNFDNDKHKELLNSVKNRYSEFIN